MIETYRGYGRLGAAYLCGRVFRQPLFGLRRARGTLLRDLTDLLRNFVRWGLRDRTVRASLGGGEATTQTGPGGWFEIQLAPTRLTEGEAWQQAHLDVEGSEAEGQGWVYAPAAPSDFVVVSDIDDTVMYTGVANKLKMMWRLFFRSARNRSPFPGVGELYRALHAGPDGAQANPMLYVSRGPWSIRPVLESFFQMHRIPVGPILFLRDWGVTLQHPLPRKSTRHKYELIERMLDIYSDRPFVLVGDSGQHDPEVYAELAGAHPGRIRVAYIRDVNQTPEREDSIRRLAEQARAAGTDLVLARDSVAMARDAAARGLVGDEVIAAVAGDREAGREEAA